jgi:monofunctional biosynthetic peptidoglycan transglycosylase
LLSIESVLAHEQDQENRVDGESFTLFDFGPSEQSWRNIDDVVMGGVSSSQMRIDDRVAVFDGKLSLENNGGFASVRSNTVQHDLDNFDGVRFRVKGDGNRYQMRIRTSSAFDGPSYQLTFETMDDVWTEVELPFTEFVAAFRGRALTNHPELNPASIATVGFLIADKQEGSFALEIDWINAYTIDSNDPHSASADLEQVQS